MTVGHAATDGMDELAVDCAVGRSKSIRVGRNRQLGPMTQRLPCGPKYYIRKGTEVSFA